MKEEKNNIYDMLDVDYKLFVDTASTMQLKQVFILLAGGLRDEANVVVSEYAKKFNTKKDLKDIEEPGTNILVLMF